MLLVVRQHYCHRTALSDCVHQFDFVDAKILGVIYNCATEPGKGYGYGYYRRYYRKYYRRYYRRYEGSYAASSKAAKKAPAQTENKE